MRFQSLLCNRLLVMQQMRHNSTNKLYELRVYSIRPSNLKKMMEVSAKPMEIRFQHSPALGYFFSEMGGLNEAIHIWEYDGYGQRAQVRKRLGADPNWAELSAPMIALFERQDNQSMRLFPWCEVKADVASGGAYFLYKFTFLPATTEENMSDSLKTFVSDTKLDLLGCWKEELGTNSERTAYAMFHAADPDSAKNPSLASADAWANLRQSVESVHSRLLSPAPWSKWK